MRTFSAVLYFSAIIGFIGGFTSIDPKDLFPFAQAFGFGCAVMVLAIVPVWAVIASYQWKVKTHNA